MTCNKADKNALVAKRVIGVAAMTALCLLACARVRGQSPPPVKWGPWKWQDIFTSGIDVRTKCLSSSNGDSKWSYQFRSHVTADFVERAEHAVPDSLQNEQGPPTMFSPREGERSAVFHTVMHGSCEKVKDIRVEILCVVVPGQPVDCVKDADGHPLEIQPFPPPPRPQPH